jgi:hypothetical protein
MQLEIHRGGGLIMSEFSSMSSDELAILSSLIAISLAEDMSVNDINLLGNFIVGVGGILLTIGAQKQLLQPSSNTGEKSSSNKNSKKGND